MLVLSSLALLAQPAPASAQQRSAAAGPAASLTVDDLLANEALGPVWLSPDGRRAAYSQTRPYAAGRPGGFTNPWLASDRVLVADLATGSTREVKAADAAFHAPVPTSPWSPDGRRIVSFRVFEGAFNFAVSDLATGRTRRLPGLPASVWAPFTWSGDRLVYAVLGEGAKQDTSNVQGLQLVERNWREVWDKGAVRVTVSSTSPVFENSAPPPGALMLADSRTGAAVKLATGDYLALAPSPNGRFLAAIRLDEAIASSYDFEGRRGELQLFELGARGATLRRSFPLLDVDENMAWSPAGDAILFAGKPKAASKGESRLYVADLTAGGLREIAPPGLAFVVPDMNSFGASLPLGWIDGAPAGVALGRPAAPPATGPAATPPPARRDLYSFAADQPRSLTGALAGAVGSFIPASDRRSALVVSGGSLWRVSPAAEPVRLFGSEAQRVNGFFLISRFPAVPTSAAYSASGGAERVALVLTENGARRQVVLDLSSGATEPLPAQTGLVALAPDFRSGVVKATSGWRSALSTAGPAPREFAVANAALALKPVVEPRQFTYEVGGTSFKAWVVDPRGGEAPGPAVVSVYGGSVRGDNPPSESATALPPPPNAPVVLSAQLLAGEGYAVVYPSLPVPPGAEGDIMTALADHAVAAVDALVAERVVDPARVAVMGHSFGGHSTASILAKRSDRFRAGIALAGVYDPVGTYGLRSFLDGARLDGREEALSIRSTEAGQLQMVQPPWKAPDAYVRNSPFFQVESINAPLLLIHGDLDRQISDVSNAERMHSALRRAGKETAIVRYWGEGHVAASPASIRDQWARVTAWLRRYLAPDPAASVRPAS